MGLDHDSVQIAAAISIVASSTGTWSAVICGIPVLVIVVYYNPRVAIVAAICHAVLVAVLADAFHTHAIVAGTLAGMVLSPAATVAATVWTIAAAALISGAWYAGLSLWWATPTAITLALVPAVAVRTTTPPKERQSPVPRRRQLQTPSKRKVVLHATPDELSLFV